MATKAAEEGGARSQANGVHEQSQSKWPDQIKSLPQSGVEGAERQADEQRPSRTDLDRPEGNDAHQRSKGNHHHDRQELAASQDVEHGGTPESLSDVATARTASAEAFSRPSSVADIGTSRIVTTPLR